MMASNRSADVLVLGAGVMGLWIARKLRQSGRTVIVLERGQPGQQASWASAGIVGDYSPRATDPLSVLRHPAPAAYQQLAAELRQEIGMDIEYAERGTILVAFDEQQAEMLERSARHEHSQGLETELVRGRALRDAEPALSELIVAARLTPGGQVDPRRLCRALEMANRRAGIQLRTGTAALELLTQEDRVVGVRATHGDVHAPWVVNCLGSWSGQLPGIQPPLPVVPQRGQILALRPATPPLQRVLLRDDDPYLVPRVDGRLVVGATRELVGYDPSLTADGIAWLLREAIAMVPALAEAPIHELWTGFRPLSADGLPVIGPGPVEGLLYATGHGPSGVTLAPGTVEIISALVDGRPNPIPWEPFSWRRFVGPRRGAEGRADRPLPGHAPS